MNKQRILIVDDNPMIAKMVGVWLERTGTYKTRQESNPLKALSAAKSFKPDLVLLDVDMPGMDGSEVGEAIRRDPAVADTPILFLTALVATREANSKTAGRRDMKFIPKPVSPARLIDRIAETLAV